MIEPRHFNAVAIGATEGYPDGKCSIDESGNIATIGNLTASGITDLGDVLAAATGATAVNGINTTERTIITAPLPASRYRVGSEIKLAAILDASGFHSTDTLTLRLKLGSTTLASLALVAADAGRVDVLFTGVVQVIGASGKLFIGDAAVASGANSDLRDPAIEDIDLEASNTLTLTAQWSVVNAENTASLIGYLATLR